MNQQPYFMNQEQEQNNQQNPLNPIIVYSQLAQGMMGGHHWPQFPAQYMAANGMMDPMVQEQLSQRFLQELKMMEEQMTGKSHGNNGDQQSQMPANYQYWIQMRNYFMEHAKGDGQQNNAMQDSQLQEMMGNAFMRYNYNKFNQEQQGVRKIGSYSLEERAKKIKKYKDKLLRWKLAHPISRSFSGRSQVANKKPRVKGRFVKNDEMDEFEEKNNSSNTNTISPTNTNNDNNDNENNEMMMMSPKQQDNEKEHQSSIETIQDIDRKQDTPQIEEEETATVENPETNNHNINKINAEK